jgi:hypothetical protein
MELLEGDTPRKKYEYLQKLILSDEVLRGLIDKTLDIDKYVGVKDAK